MLESAGNGKYFIINQDTGDRLKYNGSAISWASSGTGTWVQWQFTEAEHGWYYIDNVGFGTRLVYNGSLTMEQTSWTGDNVQWRFIKPLE